MKLSLVATVMMLLLEGQRASVQYGRERDTLFVAGSRDGEASFRLKMEYTREKP